MTPMPPVLPNGRSRFNVMLLIVAVASLLTLIGFLALAWWIFTRIRFYF